MKNFKEYLEQKSLCEMSKAFEYTQKKKTYSFWVENPTGYNNKYFKMWEGISYTKAKKIARISLIQPKYLKHNDDKEEWILNKNLRDELNNILETKANDKVTFWQLLILTYNNDNYSIPFYNYLSGNMTFDEYENIVMSKKGSLSLNTKIPNYKELPLD